MYTAYIYLILGCIVSQCISSIVVYFNLYICLHCKSHTKEQLQKRAPRTPYVRNTKPLIVYT